MNTYLFYRHSGIEKTHMNTLKRIDNCTQGENNSIEKMTLREEGLEGFLIVKMYLLNI